MSFKLMRPFLVPTPSQLKRNSPRSPHIDTSRHRPQEGILQHTTEPNSRETLPRRDPVGGKPKHGGKEPPDSQTGVDAIAA